MTDLTAAEHRAIREAYVVARQVRGHWMHLGRRLGGPPGDFLAEGADAAADLLADLESSPIPGVPMAEGVGASLGGVRGMSDLLLERNQAFRGALLELGRLSLLAGYLGALARARGDAEPAERHARAEERLRALEERGRAIAISLADDPEAAVAPADGGPLGQAGLRVGVVMGSLGEAIDSSPIGRFARRHQ
jgi:hypothetical protein